MKVAESIYEVLVEPSYNKKLLGKNLPMMVIEVKQG